MTKQQFTDWAKGRGWTEDKYGHLQKEVGDTTYRFKISKTSVRYERRVWIWDNYEWLRIKSGYYKNLSLAPENKIKGLK